MPAVTHRGRDRVSLAHVIHGRRPDMPIASKTVQFVAFLLGGACAASALADDHDSERGRHKKHDGNYVGRTGVAWEHDYEITSGRCNRDSIGAVVGGVVGG